MAVCICPACAEPMELRRSVGHDVSVALPARARPTTTDAFAIARAWMRAPRTRRRCTFPLYHHLCAPPHSTPDTDDDGKLGDPSELEAAFRGSTVHGEGLHFLLPGRYVLQHAPCMEEISAEHTTGALCCTYVARPVAVCVTMLTRLCLSLE